VTWVETRRKLRNHRIFEGLEALSMDTSDSTLDVEYEDVELDRDDDIDDSSSSASLFLRYSVGMNAMICTHTSAEVL